MHFRSATAEHWRPVATLMALVAWLSIGKAGAVIDSDVWWHLATGDWIRTNGIPRVDPFSWTAIGQAWQPNSWLADVAMSLVRDVFGLTGISIGRALVVPAVALVTWWWCKSNEAPAGAAVAGAALTTVALAPYIVERPAVVGMLLVVPALQLARREKSTISVLVATGGVFAFWANLHGSVVVGVAVVALWAIGAILGGSRIRDRAWVPTVAAIATLVNPFGLSVYTHALEVREASASIEEWQPLSLADSRGRIYAAVILIIVITLVARWRRSDLPLALPSLFLAVGTVTTIRTAAFLLVVAAPLVALAFGWIGDRLATDRYGGRTHPAVVAVIVASLVAALTSLGTIRDAGRLGDAFSPELSAGLPSNCRLFNEYTLGGFVIDQRYPDVAVSQDGRNDLYGAAEIKRQTDLVLGSSTAPLAQLGIDCVLVHNERPLSAALSEDPDWVARAGEGATSVWLLAP